MNVPNSVVEVYRNPKPKGYKAHTTVQLGETVSPEAFPDVVLRTSDLFDAE